MRYYFLKNGLLTVLLVAYFMTGAACALNDEHLEEQWNMTYYEEDDNYISCVADSKSGSYIVAGTMGVSAINTDNDAFLYRVGQDGDFVWTAVFGGDQQDHSQQF